MSPLSVLIFRLARKSLGKVTSPSPFYVLKNIGFVGSTRSRVALIAPFKECATTVPADIDEGDNTVNIRNRMNSSSDIVISVPVETSISELCRLQAGDASVL
jgi:hypothetical protein